MDSTKFIILLFLLGFSPVIHAHGSAGGGVVAAFPNNNSSLPNLNQNQSIFTPPELAQYSTNALRSFQKLNLDTASWNSVTNDSQVETAKSGQVSYFGFGSAATLRDYRNVDQTSQLSNAMNKAARYTLENHVSGQVQSSSDMGRLSYEMRAIGFAKAKELGPRFDTVILEKGTRIEAKGSAVIVEEEEEDAPAEILFDFSEPLMDLNSNPYLKIED